MAFVFLDSYWEALRFLPREDYLLMLEAICTYGMESCEIDLPDHLSPLFVLIKPNIDSSRRNYENGKKGGRPSNKKSPG